MPEDSHPFFSEGQLEARLDYFTLPMSLNYQRDSYKLWQAALATYNDPETRPAFAINAAAEMQETELRKHLMRYKLALQPNKHIATWQAIAKTIDDNWGSIESLIESAENDFLKLRGIVQKQFKKGFPYLSGPKIFNYWSYIIQKYGKAKLQNSEYIEIAPDTHITQCSVRLGLITKEEAVSLSKEKISEKWRALLNGTRITPIEMHSPLWFWSRNNFAYQLFAAGKNAD